MRVVGEEDPEELGGTNVDCEPRLRPNIVCVGEEEGNAGRGLELGAYWLIPLQKYDDPGL